MLLRHFYLSDIELALKMDASISGNDFKREGITVMLILHLRKSKLREGKQLAQDHTVSRRLRAPGRADAPLPSPMLL